MIPGMTKLIFNDSWGSTLDTAIRIIEDPKQLEKSAATIFSCDYDEVKPDSDHVGLHIVGLGDAETYGQNRNADLFSKKACRDYHDTFVKNGHVFAHHNNKDPEKSMGRIVKSAYNEPMGRVELLIHAHKEKARDHLDRLEKSGEVPVSMACRVLFDRCTICNTLRKNASDPNQCDHVKNELGRMYDDGRIVGTHNDEPTFFDISFVTRPADRIAWSLKAAGATVESSIKLAEDAGIWVPDRLAIVSEQAVAKLQHLKKLAAFEAMYEMIKTASSLKPAERYFYELIKASADMSDGHIERLRGYDPTMVFTRLAERGIMLNPVAFYKYAMGPEFKTVSEYMPELKRAMIGCYSRMVKDGSCQIVCNESLYDTGSDQFIDIPKPLTKLAFDLVVDCSCLPKHAEQRVIDRTIDNVRIAFDNPSAKELNGVVNVLVEKYASYKLAAVAAVMKYNPDVDSDAIYAQAIAQNLAG